MFRFLFFKDQAIHEKEKSTNKSMYVLGILAVLLLSTVLLLSSRHQDHSPMNKANGPNPWIPLDVVLPLVREDFAKGLRERALSAFVMERNLYCEQETPLISIVTRSWNRPKELLLNIESCKSQVARNFEHCILRDTRGKGMTIAETALGAFSNDYRGLYISHLDDDDRLLSEAFTLDMEGIIKTHSPAIVIFKIALFRNATFERTMPKSWLQMPVHGSICTNNVLVRKDIYDRAIHVVGQHHGGDFEFIRKAIILAREEVIYWQDSCYGLVQT